MGRRAAAGRLEQPGNSRRREETERQGGRLSHWPSIPLGELFRDETTTFCHLPAWTPGSLHARKAGREDAFRGGTPAGHDPGRCADEEIPSAYARNAIVLAVQDRKGRKPFDDGHLAANGEL